MSVRMSVRPYVRMSVTRFFFRYFASGFCISAPAQLHVTDAVVYTASSNAPAHHITAPAQPPRLMPGRVSGLVIRLEKYAMKGK